MSNIFLRLLNISITAGWIVLVVVLLRFVLKKAPKWTRVVLWGLVALRLLLPVSIESVTSLVPSAETVKIESVTAPVLTSVNEYNGVSYIYKNVQGEQIVLQSGFPTLNSAINPTPEKAAEHFDTVAVLKTVAGWVWLVGVVGMLFYALISFLRLRHRVRASVKFEKGVYVCDEISDPFILGLIFPKIYLPSGMDEQTRVYVLAHERAHLKRFDHIWKPLGFLLLSVYWFNPLLWLTYILLCRDIELACDEKVVKELDDAGKAAYSEALVTASVSRRSIAACPLAFGETGVKSRVKSVLSYKKPAFWIILVAILACIAVAVCFLTMPKKNQPDAAEIVGTWEFYKQIVDTYETDWPIQEMLGTRRDVLIFRENGTGTELYIRDDVTRENPFTYTVSGNKVSITRNGRDRVPVEFTYDPENSMLRSPEDAGEGLRWYTLYVREGSISYPTVQLTNEQIAGEWKTDGLPVMEGMPPTLSGDLAFDANGTAVLHLNGDNHTEMAVNGTYDTEGSVIRFEPEDDTAVLEYYPWFDQSMLFHLSIKDFKPEYQNTALASYDPQADTIRFVVLHFGVLTFHRSIPATAMPVVQWLDYYNDFEGFSWDRSKEITVAAFPGVTFRWTAGSVEAIENGKTRTLFSGMPVSSVYFTDLTGDGKPELCATVSFGSGIVDEHIIVYDYANKQSYVLWDSMQFDFHLYTVDGALYVGKTPYMGDKQVDSGTLMMHDGVLSCRWQSDGSYTPLLPELHESELYGEWLVEEETDNDGNVLYTFPQNDLWKEYSFREDGTVVYNEAVPISSDYEKAFGHPVEYPYEVHNGYVYIAGDDTSGAFRWGYYDRETHRLTLSYNTAERTVNQTLKRMGEPEPSQKPYIGSWKLFKIVGGAKEYDTSFLAAAGGIESDTLVLSEDGTGIRTTAIKGYETKEIALTFTPEQDETVLNVVFSESYAYGDAMTARYDSENDTISLYYPDDPTMYTVYIRSGSVIDAPTSKLTIDMLVGNWETEGNTAYDPPFLPGTLTFNKNGSAVLWLKDFLRSGEAIEYTVSLDGNIIWFADQTFASYDPNTDTIRLRLPLQSAGTLVFSRVSPSAEATPQPATSSDLSKEQADAFVNGLSVGFEDGAPYGCDLVCYIDGFGECLNIDDPEAYKSASLRFEPTEERIMPIYPHFTYAKILCVGDREYYLGNIRLSKSDDQMQKYEFRDNDRTGIDASIFVPVDSSMMERNRACPERVCVIKAFDAEKREVTISFAELDEPEEDGYPAAVNYDAVEEETYTFRVTDDTMLSLIVDYQALVKPNRFFKYLEAFGWMYLYTDSDDPGVGFWIGIDGDTLLYLCEVYEE
jgi:beta-lactamase regulating signal transducer with metallopeptidase domain